MKQVQIEFPDHFEEDAPLIESKGYFDGIVAVIHGQRYRLLFYDPVRLLQEIEDELKAVPAYWEENLVVIRSVNRANIEAAVAQIAASKRVHDLRAF